jgi:hypothetical protein
MKVAACDPEAFLPLRSLVSGPFKTVEDLAAIERFLRTVVLHDEIIMELAPLPYDPESDPEWAEEEEQAGGRTVATGVGPVLEGYDFFTEHNRLPSVPDIELSQDLLQVAAQRANASQGSVYFDAHVDFLKRLLGTVENGGSALLASSFGRQAITTTRRYPELLFQHLDDQWQAYARRAEQDGLGVRVPPVLGIVLSRCRTRSAIPAVISDLRNEWSDARTKVWSLTDALRVCRTISEACEIRAELEHASRLFTPERTESDTRPIRILWEIVAAAGAGAIVGHLSGAHLLSGLAIGALSQSRSVGALLHEFGPIMFGRGAFDLARRVRGAVSQVELDALPRLLSEAEKRGLGFE